MDPRLACLASARVLVVGDLILDRYWHGATRRISPEAPVPVVLVDDTVERVGGAANVAANVAALGAGVTLVGVIGTDAQGQTLRRLCHENRIATDFVEVQDHPTTVKLRVVSQRQQLVRLDFESVDGLDHAADIVERVQRHVDKCDLIVVSDYAKGAVNEVESIIAVGRAAGRAVLVDPKGSDFSLYAGATLLTPNLTEFEAVVGSCSSDDELVTKASELMHSHQLDAILVTRGAAGMSLIERDGKSVHIPAQAQEVFDVTGAGDTVCGVLAAALATRNDLRAAMELANTAASIVVGKFGAASVTLDEIDQAAHARQGACRGVMSMDQLRRECAAARRRGEQIVMTNGCFDVLHAGHVRYLSAAKGLGTRLLVAVNDDDSVRALKGPNRPVNNVDARMEVLAALDMVDWVVKFGEDTPQKLISEILPHVLVKGGDYKVEEIAGAAEVQAAGGEVVVVDYHDGYSTSALIEQLSDDHEGTP